jgi:hypothetical protein
MSSQQSNRRIFRIEVGNISADDSQVYLQRVKDNFKSLESQPLNWGDVYKRELLLERVATYATFLKYNQLHIEEDFFIPLRDNE